MRSLAGLEPCSGRIEIAGRSGASRRGVSAPMFRPPAPLSLYSNFSVGENLLVRLGKPDIAGFGLTLKKKRMRRLARRSGAAFLDQDRQRLAGRAFAVRRQSAEGGDRSGARTASRVCCCWRSRRAASTSRANGRSIGCCATSSQAGNVVIMFCTEVLEVYEAADRAHVVTDGLMSPPISVHEYAHVESSPPTSPKWSATTARVR